jgi:hypothetical protein
MVESDWIFLAVIVGMINVSVFLIIFLNKMFGLKDEDG